MRLNDAAKLFIFAEKPAQKSEGTGIMGIKASTTPGRRTSTLPPMQRHRRMCEEGRTLLFPAGVSLRPAPSAVARHLHLERGAVLRSRRFLGSRLRIERRCQDPPLHLYQDAKRCRITGLGAIDGSGRALRTEKFDKDPHALCWPSGSSDLHFRGVMFRDPGSWNTQTSLCRDVVLRNIKLMNDAGEQHRRL